MTLTQVEVGILFTRKISSDRGDQVFDTNAEHLLNLAFQQNGKVVIVIKVDTALKDIVDGKTTLWTLIDSGIVERRFGKSDDDNDWP